MLRVAHVRFHSLFLFRIDRSWERRHQVEVVYCGALPILIGESVAIPDCRELHFMDSGNEFIELFADSLVSWESPGGVQKGIDSRVELRLGLLEESRVVQFGTPVEVTARVRNHRPDFIGGNWRRW